MDKISTEEIRKALERYDREALAKKNNNDASDGSNISDTSSTSSSKKKKKKGKNKKESSAQPKDFSEYLARQMKNKEHLASSEFKQFHSENLIAVHSWYEKACQFCGGIIRISPGAKKAELKEALETSHFNIEPEDAFAFAILGPIIFMLLGLGVSFAFLNGDLFFVSFFMLASIGIMIPLTKLPYIFANTFRLRSSREIVLAVFYIVTYMRQNSNLEKAIEFASEHLSGPLGAELMKVLWDVETEKYKTIKESLDAYLEKWRKTNGEFLEAMNLVEASLYEPGEDNRVALLDKALDVILTETYEKMLHYSHDIQSPISTLHMMGVILPILGLVILPLVVSFMENVAWYHISVLYNVLIPVVVFFVGKNILASRPGGYGRTEIPENNPKVKQLREKNPRFLGMKRTPLLVALFVAIPLFLLGISPLVLHMFLGEDNDIYIGRDLDIGRPGIGILEYRESQSMRDSAGNPIYRGPYGMIATLLGICLVLSFGLGAGIYYYYKTKDFISVRQETKKLEDEFGSAVFQLGNRLGDGIPLEMSFSRVVEVMRDSQPGIFFSIIDTNIRRLGMSPEQAIFDEHSGAIQSFPSSLIESTMKVLTESIKKGPLIAARAMVNVARYVKEMHSVEERLKDLLSEVISSMKSLINFLAPVISGIVVGITAMITNIIGTLGKSLQQMGEGAEEQAGALAGLTDMFGDGIPTYAFQIVVGMYIVQIIFIISQTISGVSDGDDKLTQEYTMAVNLLRGTLLYAILTAIVMVIFNTIAMSILGRAITTDFY
ncbi:MAG: hypothetical protein ACMXYE_00600 [Candidatus Woesearchaeota archaeon]